MKVKIFLLLFCLAYCTGYVLARDIPTTLEPSADDILVEPVEDHGWDLNQDTSIWRWWKWWKWGQNNNNDLESIPQGGFDQDRSLRRRPYGKGDRSRSRLKNKVKVVLTIKQYGSYLTLFYFYGIFAHHMDSESSERIVINQLFEAMLPCIVESWTDITPPPLVMLLPLGTADCVEEEEAPKAAKPVKSSRKKTVHEILEEIREPAFIEVKQPEMAIVSFYNGNKYEGQVKHGRMHGEGKYIWNNGTIYEGHFECNEIKGSGHIEWKNQTWYEGEFTGNMRHGNGLYVDSLNQRSYVGTWVRGTKHGHGFLYFDETFKNNYCGNWENNVRTGYGTREYCCQSGYAGYWDINVRNGQGFMIWPTHEYYTGEWKNGLMSGYGHHVWNIFKNPTMIAASINCYRGYWANGKRNGFGVLELGYSDGASIKGEFKANMKHGAGRILTGDGYILQSKHLFSNDSLCVPTKPVVYHMKKNLRNSIDSTWFKMCAESIDVNSHIADVVYIYKTEGDIKINSLFNDYINSKYPRQNSDDKVSNDVEINVINFDFEVDQLKKALKYHETDLRRIYNYYAKIYSKETACFDCIMMRLNLWQLYYDINVHEDDIFLIDIDNWMHAIPSLMVKTKHNPFEKIYFWQFLHSLIIVAKNWYIKRNGYKIPKEEWETVLARSFRTFMHEKVLVHEGAYRGSVLKGCIAMLPLKEIYNLYLSIGEPHSILDFMKATRYSPLQATELPPIVKSEIGPPLGALNRFIIGDEFGYICDSSCLQEKCREADILQDLKLFNFQCLSTTKLISIFQEIFPCIEEKGFVITLSLNITFFEFIEAFVNCARECEMMFSKVSDTEHS